MERINQALRPTPAALTVALIPAALLMLKPAACPADAKTNVQEESPEKHEKKTKTKKGLPSLSIPKKWPLNSAAGHLYFNVGIGTGTGYIKGKVYDDNPKTPDIDNDGPKIRDNTVDTGPVVRWSGGYILKRGLGFGFFARFQLTNGQTTGYDRKFDAWIIGVRVLRLVFVRQQLNILPFLCLGYGRMRHVIRNTILPKGNSGDFYRASGNFDAGAGVHFVYRFTPVFNFFVDLICDVMFPEVSVNLDAVIGLGLSY